MNSNIKYFNFRGHTSSEEKIRQAAHGLGKWNTNESYDYFIITK